MLISKICVARYFRLHADILLSNKLSSMRSRSTSNTFFYISCRYSHSTEAVVPKLKYTAKLVQDVEEKLTSCEMKHRKHPGIRKQAAIALPSKLIETVYNLISDYEEKKLIEDAKKLNVYLYHRRLPIELGEVEARTDVALKKIEDKMGIQLNEENMNKKIMNKLKKQLNCELKRWKPIDYNRQLSMAYVIARMAANYAAAIKIFSEIKNDNPSIKPKTFFDFGSGVGSATWAAHSVWGKSILEYFCVDTSADMNNLSQFILQGGDEDKPMHFETVFFRQFLPTSNTLKYDVVVSAFSLMELSSVEERLRVIDILWQKTNNFLVIIENGGFGGFSVVLDVRDYILKVENENTNSASGAHIISPCPHEKACPLFENVSRSPCHFHVNYHPLFPIQDSTTVCQDTFSYVVLRKGQNKTDIKSWPRIVKPVVKRTNHVRCHLCCADGQLRELVFTKGKHGRHAYRCAKESSEGDQLPVTVHPLNELVNELNSEDFNCNNNVDLVK